MIFLSDIRKFISEAINPRVNDDASKPLNRILGDEVASLKGFVSDLIGSVIAKINLVPNGAVKSSQEGLVSNIELTGGQKDLYANSFNYSYYYDLTISPVNIDKSVVYFFDRSSNEYDVCGLKGRLVAADRLRIYNTTADGSRYRIPSTHWRIIEFF